MGLTVLFGQGQIERPPEQYRTGPVDAQYLYMNNPDRFCKTVMGPIDSHLKGCYIPPEKGGMSLIVLPDSCDENGGTIGDICKQLIQHEEAHARGWRHNQVLLPNWLRNNQ